MYNGDVSTRCGKRRSNLREDMPSSLLASASGTFVVIDQIDAQ